jgi:ribosomal protein L14
MIIKNTILKIIDNSGAVEAKCIQVFKKGKSPKGSLGGIVKVVVSKTKVKSKIKKGELFLAKIVRVRTKKIGLTHFEENGAILLKNQEKTPLANKILGSIDFSLVLKSPILALLNKARFF